MGIPAIVVSVLILCSVALFWWRFRNVARIIASAKKNVDLEPVRLQKRVSDFVSEVLLQSKVIRERPLPGLAHAWVFWGFCAFVLVSLNHIAMAYGLTVLTPGTPFGRVYYGFVAVFAAAVSVSIVGLAYRRFVVRPPWLGPVSIESGVIAGLILLLMLTFLAALMVDARTVAGQVIWWLHTLALLVFLPLIPHTKHLHLVLSPAAIFLKRPVFSDIPPLVGDEDFGLVSGKDVTQLDALQAFSCVECGRCTEHCPATSTGKVLNPKQVILGLRSYLNEHGTSSEEPLLGTHISQEAAFQCTTCGGCEYQCPVGIQHLPVIIGLRRGAVNTGTWEDPYGTKLFLTMERTGNSLGLAASERQKFIERNELPIYDGTQEYCLWLGCMGAYDPGGREIILSLVRVLRYLEISFGVLRKEKCTGDPARRLGNDLLFGELASQNTEQLETAAVKKLVSICPHCVRTIGTDWKEAGKTWEIEHHTELLARFSDRLPEAAETAGRTVYHDACYLGRYRGIYDEPRDLLAKTTSVVDPPRSRERGFCCGAGGGMMFLGEEQGKRINVARAEELIATGADTVAAACPFCQSMLRDALGASTASPPKLFDVVQITAASLPEGKW